jgi:hypothetical protein
VTGLGSSSSLLYALGTYYDPSGGQADPWLVETFSWTGTVGSSPFIADLQGMTTAYDCAWRDDLIWVSCDASDSPVKAYNTSGALVDMIPGSVVEGAASGLDFDENGILWVANKNTDKIYGIDLTLGVEGGPAIPTSLTSSCNPFMSSVTIEGTGFGLNATFEAFDLCGRLVFSSGFDGSVVLDGSSLPAGTYVVLVNDGEASGMLRLVKL